MSVKKYISHIGIICTMIAVLLGLSLPLMHVQAAEEPDPAESKQILWIGGSLFYYNDMPLMVETMAESADDAAHADAYLLRQDHNVQTLPAAMDAVIRTQGQASRLTEEEKGLFRHPRTGTYSEELYAAYTQALWDTDASAVRDYDAVILQTQTLLTEEEKAEHDTKENGWEEYEKAQKETLKTAVTRLADLYGSDTAIILTTDWQTCQEERELWKQQQKEWKDLLTEITEKIRAEYTAAGKEAPDIRIADTGAVMSNYLFYTEPGQAQKLEPEAYQIYGEEGVYNDILLRDAYHPTQLGSYLEGAVLYAAMYGNPYETAEAYTAGVMQTLKPAEKEPEEFHFASAYRDGLGFMHSEICRQAAYLAKEVQTGDMDLKSDSEAEAWKQDDTKEKIYNEVDSASGTVVTASDMESEKTKYVTAPVRESVTVLFRGNGSEQNTFATQTYFPDTEGQSFRGEIRRTGYRMLGWSEDPDAETPEYEVHEAVIPEWIHAQAQDHAPSGTMTLYAVWEPVSAIVYYNMNLSWYPQLERKEYHYGQTTAVFPDVKSRTGYRFLGWATTPDATRARYAAGSPVTDTIIYSFNSHANNNGYYMLYAVWAPLEITIFFDGNDSYINTFGTQTVRYGDGHSVLDGDIIRKGYRFTGWTLEKGGPVIEREKSIRTDDEWLLAMQKKTGKESVIFYASWEKVQESK